MARHSDEIEDLKAQLAAMQEVLAQVQAARLSDPGLEAVKELARNARPRENPNYKERSPFHRADGSKSKLSRPTFFAGSRQFEDLLSSDEIDAFNAFTTSREVKKPNGMWKAEVRMNGSAEELHVDVPAKTLDDRQDLPPLLMILLELQSGKKAVDPLALAQRVADLEAKLASAAA